MSANSNSAVQVAGGRRSFSAFISHHGFVWGLLAPALIFFAIFNVIPLIWMVGLSFYNYTLTTGSPPMYTGLGNYTSLLADLSDWSAFSRTFIFMLLTVSLSGLIGSLLGLFFWGSKGLPGRRVALTMLFTPMLLTPASVGVFFKLMLNPNFGVISYIAQLFTGARVDFLSHQLSAEVVVLLVDVWMWTPFMTLITLAALASVPQAELEAARVDRLSWLATLRRVIFPHAKFILMLGLLLRTIDAFKTTDVVLLLTHGGPGASTELLGMRIYRLGFNSLDMGSASTMGVVALIIAIGFTSLYLYVLSLKRVEA
ncbi:carbohydrate ABC transporter permease [Salinisphaera sp. LB1]|uniref:carbohydrate ABC transporter permease n=1 Tax=Salinisphaera sp. LB1 TaxID=2183911 RepID=UPI000D706816|nr:sugar ABC transporter permease [Salinisphaera sp. LB1]AWN15417.1 Dihydroxyacetone ABC transport system, permease protein 2 predicted [Salinisphaera sp. LB1]